MDQNRNFGQAQLDLRIGPIPWYYSAQARMVILLARFVQNDLKELTKETYAPQSKDRMKTAINGNPFDTDASRYAAYLDTPEGRLRTDLTYANLLDFLSTALESKSLSALDLGCGTGASSVRLARLGIHVTLVDSSSGMIDLAERTIIDSGVREKIKFKIGDASRLEELFPDRSFDIIVCHNLLEYVDDPSAVLCGAVRLLRDSCALLSVLVRNQAGEVLKAALKTGDLAAAERNLSAEWGKESLYSGKVRLFTPESLEALLRDASLTVITRRGVRVIADYLQRDISQPVEWERILALERELCARSEFFGVARYMHYLVRPRGDVSKGE